MLKTGINTRYTLLKTYGSIRFQTLFKLGVDIVVMLWDNVINDREYIDTRSLSHS